MFIKILTDYINGLMLEVRHF